MCPQVSLEQSPGWGASDVTPGSQDLVGREVTGRPEGCGREEPLMRKVDLWIRRAT